MASLKSPWLKTLAPLLALAALAACAVPTPYQPLTGGLGYEEAKIAPEQYRVSFTGNARTSKEVVDRYLLQRAAELTREQGYDYFIAGPYQDYYDPQGIAGMERQGGVVRRSQLLVGSGVTRRVGEEIVDRYGGSLDILMQKGVPPDQASHAYSPEEILGDPDASTPRPTAPSPERPG
jgi:hypothetical protein